MKYLMPELASTIGKEPTADGTSSRMSAFNSKPPRLARLRASSVSRSSASLEQSPVSMLA